MPNYQITIPSGGVTNITSVANGFVSTIDKNTMVQKLTIQNNAANNIRAGMDSNTSVTVPAAVNGGTAGKGILILPTGSDEVGSLMNYNTMLSDWWVSGSSGDVIDILFVP